jgi:Flp pilus assembly protein TadD
MALEARILALQGRADEALAILEGALETNPNSIAVLAVKTAILWQQSCYGQAAAACRRILDIEPNNAFYWNSLGLCSSRLEDFPAAALALEKAIDLDTENGSVHHNLAIVYHKQDRIQEAVREYRTALRLCPDNVEIYENLGLLLASLGSEDAAALFQKGADLLGSSPRKDLLIAQAIFHRRGDIRQAETLVRSAIAGGLVNAASTGLLGIILQQLGKFEEAASAFERSVELAPDEPAPFYDIVNAKKITPDDQGLIERIERALNNPRLRSSDRVMLLFALGKAQNDLGSYQRSLESFQSANDLRSELYRLSYDSRREEKKADWLRERYNSGSLATGTTLGSDSALPVLIVGMPRSGTTLTERVISSHPDVAAGGELPFWAENFPDITEFEAVDFKLAELRDGYLRALQSSGRHALRITDKFPENFWRLGAILAAFPQAKVIHVRRHPVDTCLSLFTTPFLIPPPYVSKKRDLVAAYRTYQRVMDHWRVTLTSSQLLEVDYAELVENLGAVARRMIGFVGLPWDDACLRPQDNPQEIRTASLWQARQPVFKTSVARWKRYAPWLGELAELLTVEERQQVGLTD